VLSQHIGPFSCRVTTDGDHALVEPQGEMDMASVGAVEAELRRVRAEGFDHVVLDLAGLTFMDSSGLHLVIRWTSEAARDGFKFELEPGPPAVQRIFELTAVDETLPWRRQR